MAKTKKMKLASRGKRLGGYCLDVVIPTIIMMIILAIVAVMIAGMSKTLYNGYGYGYDYGYDYGYSHSYVPSAVQIASIGILSLAMLAYGVVQLIFFSKSMTIGKAILGMQAVSAKTGKPIGFWKMLFREWFVKKASASVFWLGYIWIIIDNKSRGWHDLILETYVVDIRESAKIKEVEAVVNVNEDDMKAASIDNEAATSEPEIIPEEEFVPESEMESETEIELVPESKMESETEIELVPESKIELETEVEISTEPEAEKESPTEPKVGMSLKKKDLLAIAKERGVKIGSSANKEDIIAAIEEQIDNE